MDCVNINEQWHRCEVVELQSTYQLSEDENDQRSTKFHQYGHNLTGSGWINEQDSICSVRSFCQECICYNMLLPTGLTHRGDRHRGGRQPGLRPASQRGLWLIEPVIKRERWIGWIIGTSDNMHTHTQLQYRTHTH